MTSILTGDIIGSKKATDTKALLSTLKSAFQRLGIESNDWDIFRGDSFQLEVKDIEKSLEAAIYIKACVKTIKGLDVRIAIGIGHTTYRAASITESTGTAHIYSGETLESLKAQKLNLKIKTDNNDLDTELNLYFRLGLIAMDNWSTNSAEVIRMYIENPELLQKDIAKRLEISQNAVSKRQKRAYLDEIIALNNQFRSKIKTYKP